MWVGAGMASARSVESKAAEPGKTDRRWPSPPTPRSTRSKTGQPSTVRGRPAARSSSASAAAHQPGAARRRRSPRRSGTGGCGRREGHARPAAAGRALLAVGDARAGCRRTASRSRAGGRAARSGRRPTRRGRRGHGIASPQGRRGQRAGRSRRRSSRRSSPSRRAARARRRPSTSAAAIRRGGLERGSGRVGDDDDRRVG